MRMQRHKNDTKNGLWGLGGGRVGGGHVIKATNTVQCIPLG